MPIPPGLKLTPTLLNSLKQTQLRALASSLGTPITGTKKVLAEGVCAALGRSRFPIARSGSHDGSGMVRILSVDMGIRNLAVCLLEVPLRAGRGEVGGEGAGREGLGMERHSYKEGDGYMMVPSVIAWQRMSVPPRPVTTTTTTNATTTNNTTCSESIADETPSPTPPESFSASTFSYHAYNLAITLLGLSGPTSPPHQILIETQRYRSAGGAAVQEWTLRVNMLESMLWGCLRTLAKVGFWGGNNNTKNPKESCSKEGAEQESELIEGVSPIKVTGFWEGWLAENGVVEGERLQTAYAESKRSKTRIVKGLLCPPYTCTQIPPSPSSVSSGGEEGIPLFELGTDEARETAGLFLVNGNESGVEGAKKVRRPAVVNRKTKKQPKGKLDDLADCLLQGLAWVKWEEGRRRVVSGEGVLAGVDIAQLLEGEVVQKVVKKVKRKRRKVIEEEEEVVGEALGAKVEVAVEKKRRARVKKINIQKNDEITPQEVTLQEIEAGKGTEVGDTLSSLIPIVVPAKKPRKPRAKKVPTPEIICISPLGSETGADEGTIITQDSGETTLQDIIAVFGKEEVEARLKPVVVGVKDTPPTPIQIGEPIPPPTKKTRRPCAKKVPLVEFIYIAPGLETGAGDEKVTTQATEEIIPQEIEKVCGKEAMPELMGGIHTAAPEVKQIVEPVPPPSTKKTRKPRVKKLPLPEIIYVPPLGSETEASEGMVIAPGSAEIARQEVEAVARNGEAELQPEPEPGMDMEATTPTPVQIVEPALPPTKRTRKPRAKKVPLVEFIYTPPVGLETGVDSGEGKGITQEDEGLTAPEVQIVERVGKMRKPRTKKQPSQEINNIYIPPLGSETGGGKGEETVAV